jgi:copper chaperone CopZ
VEQLVVTVPDMWADHHVLKVRTVLTKLPGVADIAASARDFEVRVAFDPGVTAEATVLEALAGAGYPPGLPPEDPTQEMNKPAWAAAPRVTATDATDLAMSGDYRQY